VSQYFNQAEELLSEDEDGVADGDLLEDIVIRNDLSKAAKEG